MISKEHADDVGLEAPRGGCFAFIIIVIVIAVIVGIALVV